MQLAFEDVALFKKLHAMLMVFVNKRLDVCGRNIDTLEQLAELPPEIIVKVRDAIVADIDVIRCFVDENPDNLQKNELDIVSGWKHLVAGRFYVFRELKKYTVFLTAKDTATAYGVLALSNPFELMIGPRLPVMVDAVLLPFKDKIIYDGLMSCYQISFGPGIRTSMNENFKNAKARCGIVESLPMSDARIVGKETPKVTRIAKAKPDPKKQTADVLEVILTLINQFCERHLNEEYAALSRTLAEKLSRKRPSPLLSGSPSTWASGIVRAIGWTNFLHDPTQKPHMRLTDIDTGFGISESAGAAKLATIRKLFGMRQLDPQWTLPSRMDANPMVWMIRVNGFIIDIRHEPRETQEAAFRKGLIPYIPADKVQ